MMVGLGASQYQEELHAELLQQKRQNEDAQQHALRSQIQLHRIQENVTFNQPQDTEHIVRLGHEAKQFHSYYEDAMAEQHTDHRLGFTSSRRSNACRNIAVASSPRAFGTPESRKKELDACMRKEDDEELIENSFRYKETKDKENSSERADQSQP
jgi:hypothetical protein